MYWILHGGASWYESAKPWSIMFRLHGKQISMLRLPPQPSVRSTVWLQWKRIFLQTSISMINHELIRASWTESSVDLSSTYRSPKTTTEFPKIDNQGLGGLGAGGPLLGFSPRKYYHTHSVCSGNQTMHLVSVLDHRWGCLCIHPSRTLERLTQCALKTYALGI